jgi:hypothetical protein
MDTVSESRYREGLARLVLAACLLLFATSLGVLFLGAAALGPPGLFGGFIFITSFAFTIVGFGLAFDGFALMTRHQDRSSIP